MTTCYCWQCGEGYGRSQVLDIPVFKKGYTIQLCFNCVMEQLEWSDYRLVKKPDKYKRFRIGSLEDSGRRYQKVLMELELCFENQFRKLKDIDKCWGELHSIA